MFISWYWLLLVVVLVVGYVHALRRRYKACRHERDAVYEGYQRAQVELKRFQRAGQTK
ncbi:hypothetical protein [Kosakonia cowanii]|uniref:hypothetical protein n=1 Tax=Kosakonia cowanii TaxID=208223 RepID=UPI0025A9E825|nr:hypothetical protein [Kosakonia cowanii]MDM9615315.1 hypothetical protein [Kosakonia cowanii]MDP4560832.1 hypothetical protein [Kosakonia cowanii]